jgi:hypothetical protein
VRRELVTEMAFRRAAPFDWLIGLDALFSRGVVYVPDAVVQHRIHGGNQCNKDANRSARWLDRLNADRIMTEISSVQWRRTWFLERLEHLEHSPVLSGKLRHLFGHLDRSCRAAWVYPATSFALADRKLYRLLVEQLRPLAGSDADWRAADDHLAELTLSRFHPKSVYRSAMRLFWW